MQSTKLPRKAPGVSAQSGTGRRWPLYVAGGALIFSSGYGFARLSSPKAAELASDRCEETLPAARDSKPAALNRPRPIVRPFVVRSVDSCSGGDPEQTQSYRAKQAADLMALLRQQTRGAEKLYGRSGPEAVANMVSPYLAAWAHTVVRTAPDLAEELAAEMEQTLCGSGASDAQTMVVSRAMAHMPELGNARAFDCVADRGKEDGVLWDALDAWRLSDLPLTPALEKLAKTSKDERTLRRLVKQDEEPDEPPAPIAEARAGEGEQQPGAQPPSPFGQAVPPPATPPAGAGSQSPGSASPQAADPSPPAAANGTGSNEPQRIF